MGVYSPYPRVSLYFPLLLESEQLTRKLSIMSVSVARSTDTILGLLVVTKDDKRAYVQQDHHTFTHPAHAVLRAILADPTRSIRIIIKQLDTRFRFFADTREKLALTARQSNKKGKTLYVRCTYSVDSTKDASWTFGAESYRSACSHRRSLCLLP